MATKTKPAIHKEHSRNRRATVSSAREVYSIRFSPDEISILRKEASAQGKSVAGLVRDVVLYSFSYVRGGAPIVLGAHTVQPGTVTITGDLLTRTLTAA